MSEELTDKIIGKINTEQIEPTPRWHFVFWRGLFWSFAILSVVIGGLAVGAILFLVTSLYLTGLLSISHDLAEYLLMIPYLWLMVLVLFILIARTSVRHTKKGYKYGLSFIIFVSVISSIILGLVFYYIGVGEITHEFLNSNVPFYDSVVHDAKEAQELHDERLPQSQFNFKY